MAQKINVLIIHYNTPVLTECLVKSINKFTPNANIYIFDNSDKLPFKAKFDNVTVFDNTKGKYINFDQWLKKFPKRETSNGKINGWGSAKHCVSVEKCMSLINGNFILVDSDVLLKRDISSLFQSKYIYVGEVVNQARSKIKRVLPYLCFINSNACKKNRIHYFDPNYMHGLNHNYKNKKADSYDTGAGFYIACEKLPKQTINLDNYVVHYSGGSWKDVKERKYKHAFTPDKWLRYYAKYWADEKQIEEMRNRKVVYTCITGNYEPLDEPIVVSDGFDYVCFTDSKEMHSDIWEFRPIPQELSGLTTVKKQRCIKICPHKYLPEYSLSVWVDGSVKLTGDINKFIHGKCQDGIIFIPQHPKRKCIYKEEEAVIGIKKDKKANTWPQILRYQKEGFPKDYGLVQSNIVIRKHNDPKCVEFMDHWWNEVRRGSHRDQLSFDYVRWKHKDIRVNILDKGTCESEYFQWDNSHGKKGKKIDGASILGTMNSAHGMPENLKKRLTSKPKPTPKPRETYEKMIKSNPITRKRAVSERLAEFLRA